MFRLGIFLGLLVWGPPQSALWFALGCVMSTFFIRLYKPVPAQHPEDRNL